MALKRASDAQTERILSFTPSHYPAMYVPDLLFWSSR